MSTTSMLATSIAVSRHELLNAAKIMATVVTTAVTNLMVMLCAQSSLRRIQVASCSNKTNFIMCLNTVLLIVYQFEKEKSVP